MTTTTQSKSSSEAAPRRPAGTQVLDAEYYHAFKATGSKIGTIVRSTRLEMLVQCRDYLKGVIPAQASDVDIYELINVLFLAGAPVNYLSETINVGTATINRWKMRKGTPQPIIREAAITKGLLILEDLIRKSKKVA